MTREEAVKIFHATTYPPEKNGMGSTFAHDRKWSERAVDVFVALGMLKLDEPKSAMTIFFEEMGWPEGCTNYRIFYKALDKAGCKIVSK